MVIESPAGWYKWLIKIYSSLGFQIWIVEPFHALHHHHKNHPPIYPLHIPSSIQRLIDNQKIHLLKADEFKPLEIYTTAAELSVDAVELVYEKYSPQHKKLVETLCRTLQSPETERVFKKYLCEKLCNFYSLNVLLSVISRKVTAEHVLVMTKSDIRQYREFSNWVQQSHKKLFGHERTRFSRLSYVMNFLDYIKKGLAVYAQLLAQTLFSFWGSSLAHCFKNQKQKKDYKYGVVIIGPWQLANQQRRPGFIIDQKTIKAEDVIFFPTFKIKEKSYKESLQQLSSPYLIPPRPGRLFSNFPQWMKLFWLSMSEGVFRNVDEISNSCVTLFNYIKWKKILETVRFKHLISHSDFGFTHVGRNIALHQEHIETWYYTDSINLTCALKKTDSQLQYRHPFWTYLYYDHFVTWTDYIKHYFQEHPQTFQDVHVVGCLWTSHIKERQEVIKDFGVFKIDNLDSKFIVAAFDTTYSYNGGSAYSEGCQFAEDLLRLADTYPDVYIFLKAKKDRALHSTLDPFYGNKLVDLYDALERHPRISIISNQYDTAVLISLADFIVSFPFTSTTFEARSARKEAVWHDPMGIYRGMLYSRVHGMMTHGFEELSARMNEVRQKNKNSFSPAPVSPSDLIDPFCDGKAIERFRQLLTAGVAGES